MLQTALRFVFPSPSSDELLATLRMPAAEIRESSRATGLLGALLFATDSGRALLYETLRLDLSAEFLGFLVECEDLRLTADDWFPFVAFAGPDASAPLAPDAGQFLLSSISLGLTQLVARYIDFNAPHYVSINSGEAAVLSEAAVLLPTLLNRAGEAEAVGAAVAAIERVLIALANAEIDVFELVADPLRMRLRARPDLFDKWTARVLKDAAPQSALLAERMVTDGSSPSRLDMRSAVMPVTV
jgi:hypothetical protein